MPKFRDRIWQENRNLDETGALWLGAIYFRKWLKRFSLRSYSSERHWKEEKRNNCHDVDQSKYWKSLFSARNAFLLVQKHDWWWQTHRINIHRSACQTFLFIASIETNYATKITRFYSLISSIKLTWNWSLFFIRKIFSSFLNLVDVSLKYFFSKKNTRNNLKGSLKSAD